MTKSLDVSQFNLRVKNNINIRSDVVVIGLGATGSSFMLLLSHFLKYYSRYNICIYDGDYLEHSNMGVSMYGFFGGMNIHVRSESKARSSFNMAMQLASNHDRNEEGIPNQNVLRYRTEYVDLSVLEKRHVKIDYIFVFTDSNESRAEISKYHTAHPKSVVFDCRVGSYSEFEVYFSDNPSKYAKTIYYDDKGNLQHIATNNICLDQRMNFSVAMSSSALIMNLFTQFLKGDLKQDFKHIMVGNDFIGEVKGYE